MALYTLPQANPQLLGDLRWGLALRMQPPGIICLGPRGGLAALVDPPSALALAMPSRWRSSIISRSNWANPAKMLRMSRPVALLVSTVFATQVEDAQCDPLAFQFLDDVPEALQLGVPSGPPS